MHSSIKDNMCLVFGIRVKLQPDYLKCLQMPNRLSVVAESPERDSAKRADARSCLFISNGKSRQMQNRLIRQAMASLGLYLPVP